MHLSSALVAALVLADGALGGSRLWEAKAPNQRANVVPSYPDVADSLNATSHLVRRALSIQHRPGNNNAPRIWPNRKIRYCFEDDNTTIRGLWHLAMEAWGALREHGFSYEEVSASVCQSQRTTVLRIHYNDEGKLSSSLGIPVINEEWNRNNPDRRMDGPFTRLSDMEGVGQDNIQANVAHELGHVWGLHHEHQNLQRWRKSEEHRWDAAWSNRFEGGDDAPFQTNGFNCESLKDHGAALLRVQAKIAENPNKYTGDDRRICTSQAAASEYGFSALDWLPLPNMSGLDIDEEFDRESLMLYPSRAGGNGLGDNRDIVMTYADGSLIDNRVAPSDMDVARLVTLYGSADTAPPGEPHGSKSSGFKNKFRRMKSRVFRGGDTAAGLC